MLILFVCINNKTNIKISSIIVKQNINNYFTSAVFYNKIIIVIIKQLTEDEDTTTAVFYNALINLL